MILGGDSALALATTILVSVMARFDVNTVVLAPAILRNLMLPDMLVNSLKATVTLDPPPVNTLWYRRKYQCCQVFALALVLQEHSFRKCQYKHHRQCLFH